MHIKPTCYQVLHKDTHLGDILRFKPILILDGDLVQLRSGFYMTAREAYLKARRFSQAMERRYKGAIEYTIEPLKPRGQEFEPLPGGDEPPKGRKVVVQGARYRYRVGHPPEPLPSALETFVATTLCQYGRVTRDMPSAAELERAMPRARSIISAVRNERKA